MPEWLIEVTAQDPLVMDFVEHMLTTPERAWTLVHVLIPDVDLFWEVYERRWLPPLTTAPHLTSQHDFVPDIIARVRNVNPDLAAERRVWRTPKPRARRQRQMD